MRFSSLSRLAHYVLRFSISGGIATLAHWLLMALLIQQGIAPVTATAVGALTGALVNYVMQFHFTFGAKAQHQTAIPSYIVAVIISWVANLLIFRFLLLELEGNAVIAQLLTTGIVMLLNMFWYKRFVFNERIASPRTH